MRQSWVLSLLLFSASASASVVAYTDQSAYLAASAPDQSTFGFSGGNLDYSTAAGLTVDGVHFVGTLEDIPGYYYLSTDVSQLFNGATYLIGGFSSYTPSNQNPNIYEYVGDTKVTFPGAITSVSFGGVLDYSDVGSATFRIAFSNGDVYDGNLPWTNPSPAQFIGFVSSVPFTSLVITPGTPAPGFTDPYFNTLPTAYYTPDIISVSYGPVPEPSTFLLLGAGLVLTCVRRYLLRDRPGGLSY